MQTRMSCRTRCRRGDPASADALAESTDESFHKVRAAIVRDGAEDVLDIMPSAPRGKVGGSDVCVGRGLRR